MDKPQAARQLRQAKSREQLAAENALLRAGYAAARTSAIVQTAIRWAGGVAIAYFASETLKALAGKTTLANIVLNLLANVTFSSSVAWLAGAGGVTYGLVQRRLRGADIARLSKRASDLELKVDPMRTSSHLTARGDTNPKDQT